MSFAIHHRPFEFMSFSDRSEVQTVLLPTFVDTVFFDERDGVCTPAQVDLPVQDAFRSTVSFSKQPKSSV